MASPEAESAPVLFRRGKKRKAYRQRTEEDEPSITEGASSTATAPAPTSFAPEDDSEERSVAEALRLRNARKHRNGGVVFRAGPSSNWEGSGMTDENPERSMVIHDSADGDSAILGGITQRFAPQTGLVGELVNKHMEEYVESELARRKRHAAEALQKQEDEDAATKIASAQPVTAALMPGKQVESQRVLHGKLLEIDLGDEARARNIERTERARRRLEGLGADEIDDSASGRHKRPRLGPDGKPWRSRNRRGSEDIKRDQLVEEFLSENSLGVYDVQPEQPVTMAGLEDDEMAADDRIAEEFRREFMDAMSQRRRRKAVQPAKSGVKKDEEVLKGPKLGGSRNARAAMRDILLKEQEKKKRW
ncbi:hepatocellular carcinoma-associated antigen 59-domain-containing protein [Podospora aff. communis PSN243]|uniref:Hepatocellular carcinoma-associated antigen 59-domain-containing protein n=1 Tax=Podospora aff. communis PSN243 TaxID=3040156 RepID=A0AAV9GML6_9PEZI|nr:hepatocellular carcinoma-associated antigen 59-domain-containing protein [Podospora aff. communis PSN243]